MEFCPKCKRMTAEKNHYTGKLICYNRFCDQERTEAQAFGSKENKSVTSTTEEKKQSKKSFVLE